MQMQMHMNFHNKKGREGYFFSAFLIVAISA